MGAAKLLAPQFNYINNIEEMDWASTEKVVASSTTADDVGDLRIMILTISRANPNRAASALARLINDELNLHLKVILL